MTAAVVTFPGINRETDVARAIRKGTGRQPAFVWHTETTLPAGTDLVVLPGGFSYGDYLRCGAIAARAPIMDAVRAHAAKGGYVLAVCNGFQIACEAGLLPGVLMRNAGLKFVCRMQHLKVTRGDTDFTRHYQAGGPVIVLDSGESSGTERLPYLDTGIVDILANATGGLGIVLEHRYYGESVPVLNFTTDSLRYVLVVRNAAAFFTLPVM